MSILIYAESAEGKFKKVAFELASYKKKVESLGTTVTAVVINPEMFQNYQNTV
jgi:electron transfer flavoprotein alpha subunit